jgi:uncharacterized membrane protein
VNIELMTEPAENYIPQAMAVRMRRHAFWAWGVFSLLVLGWVFLILLPPAALAQGYGSVASPVYKFFSFICHQKPERSFYLAGRQFGVCSRCFGVYFGLFAGFAVYPLCRRVEDIEPLPRIWLFLAMAPIGIDWALGVFGIWDNTHLSRFITGLILGFACATYIIPAIVEICRCLFLKPRPHIISGQ